MLHSAIANPKPNTPTSTLVTMSVAVLPSDEPGWLARASTCGALNPNGTDSLVPAAEDEEVVAEDRVGDTEGADGERMVVW